MKKKIAVTVLLTTAVGLFCFIFFNKDHKIVHIDKNISLYVTKPWREDLDIHKEYVAQIKSIQHIEIRSLERGYLDKIYVDEGQFIKKGTEMFQIMPLFLEAEWEKAKAEFNISKIEYENTKMLASKNIVSKNELLLSKAKLDKSKAKQKLAKIHLQFTTVRAPFDGIMDRFRVRLGSLVAEGQLLTTLSDNSEVWVYFNVSEVDYLEFKHQNSQLSKMPVKLKLANGKLFNKVGKIDTVEADFNNKTGNIAFRASFSNPNGLLRHGQTGTVILTEHYREAMVIPQKSTFEVMDKKYIYTVDDKGKVSAQEIVIENEVPHLFIIKSGINQNQKILLEGASHVHNGEKIKFIYKKPNKVKAGLELPLK